MSQTIKRFRPIVKPIPRNSTLVILLCAALLSACGGSKSVEDKNLASLQTALSPQLSASATPKILAGPVSDGKLEIVITSAREAKTLRGGDSYNETQYAPKVGYTFLVVDVVFRGLDTSQEKLEIFSDKGFIVAENGKKFEAEGAGQNRSTSGRSERDEKDFCVSCTLSVSKFNLDKSKVETDFSFVFVIKQESINQKFKFGYDKLPVVEFSF